MSWFFQSARIRTFAGGGGIGLVDFLQYWVGMKHSYSDAESK